MEKTKPFLAGSSSSDPNRAESKRRTDDTTAAMLATTDRTVSSANATSATVPSIPSASAAVKLQQCRELRGAAARLFVAGDFPAALQMYAQCLAIHPRDVRALW
jgi:hypothetical protein